MPGPPSFSARIRGSDTLIAAGSVSFIFLFFATKKHRPRGYHNVRKNSAFNASSGVRTLDTLIKSQVLCQLS